MIYLPFSPQTFACAARNAAPAAAVYETTRSRRRRWRVDELRPTSEMKVESDLMHRFRQSDSGRTTQREVHWIYNAAASD